MFIYEIAISRTDLFNKFIIFHNLFYHFHTDLYLFGPPKTVSVGLAGLQTILSSDLRG